MNKKSNLLSTCCNAEIKYSEMSPDFIGDNPKDMKIGTCYCICTKCNQPCNIYAKVRKLWTRNPVTQVQKDKRKKTKKLLTDKVIKELLKDEDF